MVEAGDALEQRSLHNGAERADDQRREDQRAPIADAGEMQQEIGGERADHVEGAVREIDDVEHAEDHGEAEAQQRIERAVDQADQQLAVKLRHRDRVAEEHQAAPWWRAKAPSPACGSGLG